MTLLRSMTIGFAALAWLGCSSAANDGAVTGSTQAAITGDSADGGADLPKLCDPSACGALPPPPAGPKGAPDGDGDDDVAADGSAPRPPLPPPPPPGAQVDQDGQPPQGPRPDGDCGGDGDGDRRGKRRHGPPPLACVEVSAGQCEWRPIPPPHAPPPPPPQPPPQPQPPNP